jgi:hypothetical protein
MCGLRPPTLRLLPGRECGERRGGTCNSDEDRSGKLLDAGFRAQALTTTLAESSK